MSTTVRSTPELIKTITGFLSEIGIPWSEGKVTGSTFVPGISIVNGGIVFDPEQMLYPGDLLHEAGHIAVTTSGERMMLNGDVLNVAPTKDGDEMAVLLWSWLAAQHCKIPSRVVFHEHGYKGDGDWLAEQFDSGNYIAEPLLHWMGIIAKSQNGQKPEIVRWLRN
ncbi:MAG: hypothetical protein ACRC3B_05280 [Bacteroidia bacterium]